MILFGDNDNFFSRFATESKTSVTNFLKPFVSSNFPPKESARYYTHDLTRLLESSGLEGELQREIKGDPLFRANWAFVKQWTEEVRYSSRGKKEADNIFSAVSDPDHGVMQWLKRNW